MPMFAPIVSSNLVGTSTNDSAASGVVGELITASLASGSAVSVTTATGKTITSISLTPGDWNIYGVVNFVLSGVTATIFQVGPSLTTNTLPSQTGGSGLAVDPLTKLPMLTTALSDTLVVPINMTNLKITSTTTVYLVAQATFSVGTLTAYGTINARRAR